MKRNEWIAIIVIIIIVAIVVSLITVNITGNTISVAKGFAGKVYTTAESDQMYSALKSNKADVSYVESKLSGLSSSIELLSAKVDSLSPVCSGTTNVKESSTDSVNLKVKERVYNILVSYITASSAKIIVNGESTGMLTKGSSFKLADGAILKVLSISYSSNTNSTSFVTIEINNCGAPNQAILDMLNACTVIPVASYPSNITSNGLTGNGICKNVAKTCILLVDDNKNSNSTNYILQKCDTLVKGMSPKSVVYCCSP